MQAERWVTHTRPSTPRPSTPGTISIKLGPRVVILAAGTRILAFPRAAVSVAGMEVSPGDIIHMDEHGAVRFPETELQNICDRIGKFAHEEERQVKALLSATTIEEVKKLWGQQG